MAHRRADGVGTRREIRPGGLPGRHRRPDRRTLSGFPSRGQTPDRRAGKFPSSLYFPVFRLHRLSRLNASEACRYRSISVGTFCGPRWFMIGAVRLAAVRSSSHSNRRNQVYREPCAQRE